MEFSPSDIIDNHRDENREMLCAKYLRTLPAQTRYEFLWEILKTKDNLTQVAGCRLVTRSVQESNFLYDFLNYALANCDVSTIKFWIMPPLRNLGIRRVIEHLIRKKSEYPVIVNAACYHLHWILKEETPKTLALFEELKEVSGFDSNSL
jgi:hypothetical protein